MPRVVGKSRTDVTVPAGQSIMVFCQDSASVYEVVGGARNQLGTVSAGSQVFGPFASGANISIDAGEQVAWFAVGVTPVMREMIGYRLQLAPVSISSPGAIPLAAITGGVINGSAGVLGMTCTLPTGAALDAASDFKPGDAFDWHVISTGLGTFIIGASAGHTIVGSAGVGSTQSGHFRTRKAGANTFVTMRIA